MRLHFLNYHHNGDIHYSKEFMRDLYNITQPEECFLHHKMREGVIKDLPFIQSAPVLNFEANTVLDDDYYIVMWIGYYFINKLIPTDKGCSLYSNHLAFKDVYEQLGLSDQYKEMECYLPLVDYDLVEKENIHNFCDTHKNKRVLIANGPVLSGQSENFDFDPIILSLSEEHKDWDFILTERTKVRNDNVFFTSDIINIKGCDLNEVSYLSLWCDVFVGRASGPIGFTHVQENYFNPKKTVVGISNIMEESFWYVPKDGFKCVWTNNFEPANVYHTIKKELCYQ